VFRSVAAHCRLHAAKGRETMTTDKTGAPTTVRGGAGEYDIAVEGRVVGHAFFADHGDQRVFHHTEVDDEFGGRGLATILIEDALERAHDEGRRIVAVCPMVVTVLEKHPEYRDTTDPVTPEIKRWVKDLTG
jgi:predicted GNAT family acetyltransferase